MKYKVLNSFTAKTRQGEKELQPGQIITLPPAAVTGLLENGKIAPCEEPSEGKAPVPWTPPPCGYLIIYSRILDDCLLVTDTDDKAQALKDSGIEDVIYSVREAKELEGLPPESLKAHHVAKKTFRGAKIEKGDTNNG